MTGPDSPPLMRWSLVIAPTLLFASGAVLPSLEGADGTQVSLATDHPNAYYLFVLFGILGSIALIPACLELSVRAAVRKPASGVVAAVLLVVGTALSLVDWGTELVKWQMGASGLDPQTMSQLAEKVDAAPGVAAPLQLSGLAFLVGMIVVAVGLIQSRTAPTWAAVGLPVALFVNLLGFVASSLVILDIGAGALLLCMASIAMRGRAVSKGHVTSTVAQ